MSLSSNSERTMLGPLTTAWTAPPVCGYAMDLCDTCTTVWQAQTCNPESNAHDFTDCWPPRTGYFATHDPGVAMGLGIYSPGIICPNGYTTAGYATYGGHSDWGVQFSMTDGETAMACCPSSYSISWITASLSGVQTYAPTCTSVARDTTVLTVQCNSGTWANFAPLAIPHTVSGSALESYVIFAPLYQLNWRAGDRPASQTSAPSQTSVPSQSSTAPPSTSSSASAGSSPTNSQPSMTQSTSQSSTTTTAPPQSTSTDGAGAGSGSSGGGGGGGGLSTGAAVGIGVGLGIAAILVLVIALVFWRRRKRGSKGAADGESMAIGGDEKKNGAAAEAGDGEIRELDGRAIMHELPTRLPSDRVPPKGVKFRQSDQGWVVPISPQEGTFSTLDDFLVSPIEPHSGHRFELEDTSSRASRETPRDE